VEASKVKKDGKYISKKVALKEQHLIASPDGDIGHCYYAFVQAYDGGKMDGFNLEPNGACQRNWSRGKAAGLYPYQYVYPNDIAPYWDMANQHVLGDAMFQTQGTGSFSAHQDLIRGGSALGGTYGSDSSLIDTPTKIPWGCDSEGKSQTDLITTSLKWEEDAGPFPCTEDFPHYSGSTNYQTLADLLDRAGVSCPKSESCPPPTECAGAELNAFDVAYGNRSQGGYIDNSHYEFGSILKYIEENWNLGILKTTDSRATSIMDAFDYNQQPRSFTVTPSTLNATRNEADAVRHSLSKGVT
jgi:hypothetical protein